ERDLQGRSEQHLSKCAVTESALVDLETPARHDIVDDHDEALVRVPRRHGRGHGPRESKLQLRFGRHWYEGLPATPHDEVPQLVDRDVQRARETRTERPRDARLSRSGHAADKPDGSRVHATGRCVSAAESRTSSPRRSPTSSFARIRVRWTRRVFGDTPRRSASEARSSRFPSRESSSISRRIPSSRHVRPTVRRYKVASSSAEEPTVAALSVFARRSTASARA